MDGGFKYCMRSVRNQAAICLEKTQQKLISETPLKSEPLPKSAVKVRPDTLRNISPKVPPPYGVLLVPFAPPVGGAPPAH